MKFSIGIETNAIGISNGNIQGPQIEFWIRFGMMGPWLSKMFNRNFGPSCSIGIRPIRFKLRWDSYL